MDIREEIQMKKLYRRKTQRMICDVCGGLAEYFNVDVTLVRLAFAGLSIICGGGFLAYIVAAIVIPEEGSGMEYPDINN